MRYTVSSGSSSRFVTHVSPCERLSETPTLTQDWPLCVCTMALWNKGSQVAVDSDLLHVSRQTERTWSVHGEVTLSKKELRGFDREPWPARRNLSVQSLSPRV